MARVTIAELLERARVAEENAVALVAENERLIAELGLRITQAEKLGIVVLAIMTHNPEGEGVSASEITLGLRVADALLDRLAGRETGVEGEGEIS